MKQILMMSALALGLCACGAGSDYRGAASYVSPQAAGPAEQNNSSCADTRFGGAVCSMSHESSNSGSDSGSKGKQ